MKKLVVRLVVALAIVMFVGLLASSSNVIVAGIGYLLGAVCGIGGLVLACMWAYSKVPGTGR